MRAIASAASVLMCSFATVEGASAGLPALMESKAIPQAIKDLVQASLVKVTPEMKTAAGVMLSSLSEIKDNIKTHHSHIDARIVEVFEAVDKATTGELEQRTAAKELDQGWVDSMQELKEARAEVDKLDEELKRRTEEMVEECDYNTTYAPTPKILTFGCSLENEEECSQGLVTFEAKLDAQLSTRERAVSEEVEAYAKNVEECNSATSAQDTAIKAKQEAVMAWKAKIEQSEEDEGKLDREVCAYRAAVGSKCAALEAHTNFVAQTAEEGNDYSDVDIREEWKTVSLAECLLTKLEHSEAVDPATCADKVNADLGPLDLKTDALKALSQRGPVRSCPDTALVELSGFTWSVTSPVHSADAYAKKGHSWDINEEGFVAMCENGGVPPQPPAPSCSLSETFPDKFAGNAFKNTNSAENHGWEAGKATLNKGTTGFRTFCRPNCVISRQMEGSAIFSWKADARPVGDESDGMVVVSIGDNSMSAAEGELQYSDGDTLTITIKSAVVTNFGMEVACSDS